MPDCIFCQIIKGNLPCARIFEDEQVISFLDINPINLGHALVVPKYHWVTLFDMPSEELKTCARICQQVGAAVLRGTGAAGMNLIQNNYRSAGQLIDHVHFHLIPRYKNDSLFAAWPGKPYPAGEMDKTLKRIRAQL